MKVDNEQEYWQTNGVMELTSLRCCEVTWFERVCDRSTVIPANYRTLAPSMALSYVIFPVAAGKGKFVQALLLTYLSNFLVVDRLHTLLENRKDFGCPFLLFFIPPGVGGPQA